MRPSAELISRSFSSRYPGIPGITFLSPKPARAPGSDPDKAHPKVRTALCMLLCWLQGEPRAADQPLGVETSLEQLPGAYISALPCLGGSMPAARSRNRTCSLSCAGRLETRDQTLLCQLLYRLCYRGAVSILLIINSFLPSDSWPTSHLHWEPATSSQHSTQARSLEEAQKAPGFPGELLGIPTQPLAAAG